MGFIWGEISQAQNDILFFLGRKTRWELGILFCSLLGVLFTQGLSLSSSPNSFSSFLLFTPPLIPSYMYLSFFRSAGVSRYLLYLPFVHFFFLQNIPVSISSYCLKCSCEKFVVSLVSHTVSTYNVCRLKILYDSNSHFHTWYWPGNATL